MIQNITDAQAKNYMEILFYRLGLDDDKVEMAMDMLIDRLPEIDCSLQECVKALNSEAREYHGHKKPTIH